MRRFAALFDALDGSTTPQDKVAALQRYFDDAPAADAARALALLTGPRPRPVVAAAVLRQVGCHGAGIDGWLFDTCVQAVGDLAETVAQVLPPPSRLSDDGLAHWLDHGLLPLRGLAPEQQAAWLLQALESLDTSARFVLVKLAGGGFRADVSKLQVQRALAAHAGLDVRLLAQRMAAGVDGRAAVGAERFAQLLAAPDADQADAGRPYPFGLARPLQAEPATLGNPADWQLEWMYRGMRAQLARRAGQAFVWTHGEATMAAAAAGPHPPRPTLGSGIEAMPQAHDATPGAPDVLASERLPEVVAAALAALPDGCVLDGELLVWPDGRATPAPFGPLQQRLGRQALTRKLLAEAPVCFVACDLLEVDGEDRRAWPLHRRRRALESLLPSAGAVRLSPLLQAADWPAVAALHARARAQGADGLMLRWRGAAVAGAGVRTGPEAPCWTWRVGPLAAAGVLLYVQAGQGRRAGDTVDCTFAVWNRPPASAGEALAVVEAIARREPVLPGGLQLVPFAKACAGLADAGRAVIDDQVRAHTVDRFGPVRSLRPTLVVELGFDDIAPSPRHKSGVAVRHPRLLRIRHDLPVHEADTLQTLRALVAGAAASA